jgi:N-acetylmuramoyl-L-alanine amidase
MRWRKRERMRMPPAFFSALSLERVRMAGTLTAAIVMLFAPCTPIVFAQTQPTERFVVLLDAAHGGADPGARLDSEPEKAYTLAFSVRLRSLLMARGIDVVNTRDSDATIDPSQRAAIADHAHAQACLSLHASQSGSGVHLFVSSVAPAQPNTMLPWKTAQAAWIERSTALAGVINSALTHAGTTVTLGRIALPAIDSMTCPAVAVEIAPGQSSDSSGAVSLDNADYQSRVADALAAALVEWRSESGDRGGRQP